MASVPGPAVLRPQAAVPAPVTPAEAAANLERTLKDLRTFQARFEQLYYASTVTEPLDEHGDIYFRKPDLMRWEYREPQRKVFLYSGGTFQMYVADDKQLTRSRISPEAYESDIVGIFLGRKSFGDLYAIEGTRFPSDTPGLVQVKLTPREEGDYSHVLIEIDPKTWLLRRAIFVEWAGNKREYIFSRIKLDADIPASVFELKVPPGTEVIDENPVIKRQARLGQNLSTPRPY